MEKILTHVIVKERVETYKDFTINLLYYIYNYYIGKAGLSLSSSKKCWWDDSSYT